ncbi:hypothetical protein ACFOZY_06875 [Chungangia koreensis]|uniref:Uncharacterized protein n=1 Tax=Chungangia koreensis TaxID=752657 RepID=A0ABV8X2M0_9LACT
MKMKRLIKTAIKWAPVIYPIARKFLSSRKQKQVINSKDYKNRTFQ